MFKKKKEKFDTTKKFFFLNLLVGVRNRCNGRNIPEFKEQRDVFGITFILLK